MSVLSQIVDVPMPQFGKKSSTLCFSRLQQWTLEQSWRFFPLTQKKKKLDGQFLTDENSLADGASSQFISSYPKQTDSVSPIVHMTSLYSPFARRTISTRYVRKFPVQSSHKERRIFPCFNEVFPLLKLERHRAKHVSLPKLWNIRL